MAVYVRRVLDLFKDRGMPTVVVQTNGTPTSLSADDNLAPFLGLGPCECLYGHAKLSCLRESFQWCVCDPNVCLLAALEKQIQNDAASTPFKSVDRYKSVSVYIRCMFDICIE